MAEMRYWGYRAYDSGFKVHTGVTSSPDHLAAILKIRQELQLQVIELTLINQDEFKRRLAITNRLVGLQAVAKLAGRPKPSLPECLDEPTGMLWLVRILLCALILLAVAAIIAILSCL